MGFDAPSERHFVISVSDTQAYRQFGNSVVVPVFQAVAEMMKPRVLEAKKMGTRQDEAMRPPGSA